MPDLLVRLYDLPDAGPHAQALRAQGVAVRAAVGYEKHQVVAWVRDQFGDGWASECDVAFGGQPVHCFVATQGGRILGFACYDATRRGFFGPVGVSPEARRRGVGTALLLRTLGAMSEAGYAYAIVGGADAAAFYARTVGAIEIPGSVPGVYRDRLTA